MGDTGGAYEQIVRSFGDDDVTTPVPELAIDPGRREIVADPREYAIRVGPRHLPALYPDGCRELAEEELHPYATSAVDTAVTVYDGWYGDAYREAVEDAVADLYDAALWDRVQEHAADVEELYAGLGLDVGVDVVNAYFKELNTDDDDGDRGTTNGKYSSSDEEVKIDVRFRDGINPETGEITSEHLDQVIRHETLHALHYGTNPHVSTLSDYISDDTGDDEYTDDVRRAAIEAITRFEQYRIHDRDSKREVRYRKLRDPWQVPDVFTDHTAMEMYGVDLFDDPYKLGHFTAHAVDAAFRDQHGETAGREHTRAFLVQCVTTPTGLTGAVEQAFYLRDLPYYPRLVQKWEHRIDRWDRAESQIRDRYETAAEQYNTTDTKQKQLQYFYEADALLTAAEQQLHDATYQELVSRIKNGPAVIPEIHR